MEEAERYVTSFCTAHMLHENTCFKVRLVIEELVTNIFKYTRATEFTLEIFCHEAIEIHLEYVSPKFDFTIQKPVLQNPVQMEEGKLGLFLVESVTETFRYRHENGKSIYTLTV